MATRTFTVEPGEAAQPWVTVKVYESALITGPWDATTLIDTQALDPIDTDPAEPQVRIITTHEAALDAAYYVIGFVDAADNEEYTAPTVYPPISGFPTAEDVAVRLGRALTEAEISKVELLLTLAVGTIAEAADEDLAWATALDPVPSVLWGICLELLVGVLLNPDGMKSGTESLGAYTRSGTYGTTGLFELTADQRRRIRRAVGLGTFAAVTLETPYSGPATGLDDQPELPL